MQGLRGRAQRKGKGNLDKEDGQRGRKKNGTAEGQRGWAKRKVTGAV